MFIKKIAFATMLALTVLLCGCSNQNEKGFDKEASTTVVSENFEESEYAEQEKATLTEMESKGEIPYENYMLPKYSDNEYLNYMCDPWISGEYYNYLDDGIFPFEFNGKLGYADANGKVLIREQYTDANFFSEGKAIVKDLNGKWKVINKNGTVLQTLPDGYNYKGAMFQNETAIVISEFEWASEKIDVLVLSDAEVKNKFSIIETFRSWENCIKTINTPEFKGVLVFYGDAKSQLNNCILYDSNGTECWRQTYQYSSNVDINNLTKHLYNSVGDYRTQRPLVQAFSVNDGYLNIIDSNYKWGLYNLKTKKVAVQCQYDYVGKFSEGVAPICKYGKWGYIDANGKEVIAPQYKYAGAMGGGRAIVFNLEGKIAVINKSGQVDSTYAITPDSNYNWSYTMGNGIHILLCNTQGADYYYVLAPNGELLLKTKETRRFVVNNKYVFADGKMYKINMDT